MVFLKTVPTRGGNRARVTVIMCMLSFGTAGCVKVLKPAGARTPDDEAVYALLQAGKCEEADRLLVLMPESKHVPEWYVRRSEARVSCPETGYVGNERLAA